MTVGVACGGRARPRRRAAGGRPGRRPGTTSGERSPETRSVSVGERAGVDVGRERRSAAGRPPTASPPDVGPAPVVRREHLVVVAGVAGCDRAGLDDGHPRCPVRRRCRRHRPRCSSRAEPSARVRAHVVADVDGGRADVVRHPQRRASTQSPAAGDESPTERPQRGVEIGERLEQEAGAVRSVERAGEDGVVEHEQRDDDVVGPAPPAPAQGGRSRAGRG